MPNCLSLISCDGQCDDIHNIQGASSSNLLPFLNLLVRVNNNVDCTYFVRRPVLIGFAIDDPKFLCEQDVSGPSNNISTIQSIVYRVNSVTYNGVELVTSPIRPEYTIFPGTYDCLFCSPLSPNCTDTTNRRANNTNAHPENLTRILSDLGLNIQAFPYGQFGGFAFRIYDFDNFTINIERISSDFPLPLGSFNLTYFNNQLNVSFNRTVVNTNLILDFTNNCVSSSSSINPPKGLKVTSVTGVTECGLPNPYDNYIEVNECDVITIHPMDVTCNVVNVLGTTGATRTATLVVTGGTPPYSYLWENGNTTPTIVNLPAGTYNAVVSDAFGDFIIETSCFLPPVDCAQITIRPNLRFTCLVNGLNLSTGQAVLSILPTGGVAPYTFSGKTNGVVTPLTNGMIVNHLDFIEIVVFDTNGCSSSVSSIGIICPPGETTTTTTTTTEGSTQPCLGVIQCPNSNQFLLSFTATTFDVNSDPLNPYYIYEFNFRLSSPTNYKGILMGSYKIFEISLPNSFLKRRPNLSSGYITSLSNTNYYRYASGTPPVSLNNYIEFGFTELTPSIPDNNASPWKILYIPYSEITGGSFTANDWVPGTTQVQIAVALFDNQYCVHKGNKTIIIPVDLGTTIDSISF